VTSLNAVAPTLLDQSTEHDEYVARTAPSQPSAFTNFEPSYRGGSRGCVVLLRFSSPAGVAARAVCTSWGSIPSVGGGVGRAGRPGARVVGQGSDGFPLGFVT
jgi:hypothetical protein